MPTFICTKKDRRWLEQHYGRVIRNDPVLAIFKGKLRRVLRDRMVEMTIAEQEGREVPPFPPAGMDVKLSRLTQTTLSQMTQNNPPDESGDLSPLEQIRDEQSSEE